MGYLAEITCLNPLDLRLTVDVVGYPSEGETILITVEEGSNTIFSVVTDCYGEALNHIHTLLEERGVEQLNAFVWTHPDSDHSMGISNLLDTFDKKRDCHIFLPAGLFSVTDHLSSIAPDSKTAFDHIKTHYIGDGSPRGTHIRKYHEISHDCDAFQRQEFRVRFVNPQDDSIDLRLIMMAPVSTQTLGFTYQTKSNLKPNPFSIVYLLEINGIKVLLTGDMNFATSKTIEDEWLAGVNLLKIPHHGSKEPLKFAKRFVNLPKANIAVTTTFKKCNLPNTETLQEYGERFSQVVSTSEGKEPYGCLHCEYSLADLTFFVPPVVTGNAKFLTL